MKPLKEILQLNWNEQEFGQSKLKADYKKQLYNIVAVDSLNNAWYNGKSVFIPDNRIMYITEQKGTTKKFISATFEKKTKGKGDNKKDYIHITYDITVNNILYGLERLEIFPEAGFNADERVGETIYPPYNTRCIVLGDYLAFYHVLEDKKAVFVSDIIHSKQDYIRLFKKKINAFKKQCH